MIQYPRVLHSRPLPSHQTGPFSLRNMADEELHRQILRNTGHHDRSLKIKPLIILGSNKRLETFVCEGLTIFRYQSIFLHFSYCGFMLSIIVIFTYILVF